jgi:ribosome silencing factor RsfS/YbeB/iojap
LNHLDILKATADVVKSKKGVKITVLDLRGLSDICDFQFVCSGQNERQTRTICKSIEEELRVRFGMKPAVIEGLTNGHWILMDYGSLNIHIFFDLLRDYYALEQVWPSAKLVDI